jgi:hypothetical protein
MTQIEDLLRTALADAPTPPTATLDPLADINRRVGRARLRLGAVAMSVVAVLVAAIVVPIAMLGGRGSTVAGGPTEVPVTAWSSLGVTSVATGGGTVWTVVERFRNHGSVEVLQHRDPSTGAVIGRTRLPAPLHFVTYGLNEVWVWGGGDGAYPNGRMAEVSPDGTVRSNVSLGYGKGLITWASATGQAMAFAGRQGYGVRENGGVVATFQPGHPESARQDHVAIKGAQRLLTHGPAVYVIGRHRVVFVGTYSPMRHRLIPMKGLSESSLGLPLAETPDGFWSWVDGGLVRKTVLGAQIGATVAVPGQPTAAVVDPQGGLYLAFASQQHAAAGLMYYSPAALRADAPRPTAVHHGRGVFNLALDPAGGVVVQGHGIGRWDPSTLT